MRHALLILIILSIGCQQINDQLNDGGNEASLVAEHRLNTLVVEPHMNMLAGSKYNNKKLTRLEQDQLAEEGKLRMKKLWEQTNLPILKKETVLTMAITDAEKKYKDFISQQSDKSIVPLYRQLYARAILRDYNLLSSNDYPKIEFYINELIKGESLDFRTITLGLVRLNGHADANFIKSTIDKLLPNMQHRAELETIALNKIKEMNGELKGTISKKDPTEKDKKMLLGVDNFRKKLENSDTKQCIEILTELNSKLSNS